MVVVQKQSEGTLEMIGCASALKARDSLRFLPFLRLLCFLLFRPEWLPLQSACLRGDPLATRSRLFHILCNLSTAAL